jgi:hypothetical protein
MALTHLYPHSYYHLSIVLEDDSGTASVGLFDQPVSCIVGSQCKELILRDGYEDPRVIPPPLQTLLGQTKVFHLRNQAEKKGWDHIVDLQPYRGRRARNTICIIHASNGDTDSCTRNRAGCKTCLIHRKRYQLHLTQIYIKYNGP